MPLAFVNLFPRLLRLIFLLLLTPVLFLLGCQSKLIYYPRPYHQGYRDALVKRGGQRIEYTTSQGRQVAHYMPPRNGAAVPKCVWICFGGNAYLGLDWMQYLSAWDPSFGYLLVDYPGYGDCEGRATPGRIRDNSVSAVGALAQRLNLTPEEMQARLGVLGHSIGCAAGLMAADDLHIQKVVLVAPFTTLTEMGKRFLGWPLCYVNMHHFNNRTHLAHVVKRGAKVVIYHGTDDPVIPISMSRELAAPYPGKVILHEKAGEEHNYILNNIGVEVGATMVEMQAK